MTDDQSDSWPPCTCSSRPCTHLPPLAAICFFAPSPISWLYSESPTTRSTLLFFGVQVPFSSILASESMNPPP